MKFNWGTGIVCGIRMRLSPLLCTLLYRMNMDRQGRTMNWLPRDYYKQELAYQKEIDAEKNAIRNGCQIRKLEKIRERTCSSRFPESLTFKNITGKVSLYRPSNRHLDFNFPISLSNTHLLIPDNRLVGRSMGHCH